MKLEVKKLRDYKYNSVNPFLDAMMEKATLQSKRAAIGTKLVDYVDTDTAEVKTGKFFFSAEEEIVDATTFRKLFIKSLDSFFDFSQTAQKVLKYFFYAMKRNKDTVDFNLSKCLTVSGLKSETSVYIGVTELLQKKIIARADTSTSYFINPAVMFNGSRLTLIRQYIKRDSKPPKAIESGEKPQE